MREKDVEEKLRKQIKAMGGLCLKFESPGFTGVPDRIILLSDGVMAFVELKAPGKKERPRQRLVQKQLRALGFTVFSAVDNEVKVREVVCWATEMGRRATHGESAEAQIWRGIRTIERLGNELVGGQLDG